MKTRLKALAAKLALTSCLAALVLAPAPLLAQTWDETADDLKSEASRIEEEARQTRAGVRAERKELTAHLAELQRRATVQEKQLSSLQTELDRLLRLEADKQAELAVSEEEIKNLESAVRVAAKDVESLLRASLITPEDPARLAAIEGLENKDRFPGMDEIEALVAVLFQEMAASGQIRLRPGRYIDPTGQPRQGEILRAGGFTAYYRGSDGVGFLRPGRGGSELAALAAEPGWLAKRRIEAAFEGRGSVLPLDLSGGAALEQMRPRHSLRDWLESGGLLVWPILLLALVAVILMAERFVVLGRTRSDTDQIMDQVSRLSAQGKIEECRQLCQSHPRTPACQVILAGLEKGGGSKEAMENAVQESILKQLPRLERFLPTLSVLAAIAPLMGLLGTVTGMIATFRVITRFGAGDPGLMAGGISEALVTTQLGLAVALPIIVIHHFLERRVDKVVGDMEEKGLALLAAQRPEEAGL